LDGIDVAFGNAVLVASGDLTLDGDADNTAPTHANTACCVFANTHALTIQQLNNTSAAKILCYGDCTDGGNNTNVTFHPGPPGGLAMMGCGI